MNAGKNPGRRAICGPATLRFRLAARPGLQHADQVAAGRDTGVVELGSVPGFVVFDLPGAPLSAGGTRLAADVSVAEVALLARR